MWVVPKLNFLCHLFNYDYIGLPSSDDDTTPRTKQHCDAKLNDDSIQQLRCNNCKSLSNESNTIIIYDINYTLSSSHVVYCLEEHLKFETRFKI